MTNPDSDYQRRTDTPGYAARSPPGSGSSTLAVVSLVLAIISCPFCFVPVLLIPINRIVNDLTWRYVAGARNNGDRMGAWVPFVLFGLMGIATLLPIVAIVQSLRRRGSRGGIIIAVIALVIALLWWPLLYMAARGAAALGGRY